MKKNDEIIRVRITMRRMTLEKLNSIKEGSLSETIEDILLKDGRIYEDNPNNKQPRQTN